MNRSVRAPGHHVSIIHLFLSYVPSRLLTSFLLTVRFCRRPVFRCCYSIVPFRFVRKQFQQLNLLGSCTPQSFAPVPPCVFVCVSLCVFAFRGEIADNFLLLSLDKGLSGRVQPGGVERVDLLGAAGRRGAVDEDQEVPHDRTYRPVSFFRYWFVILFCTLVSRELQPCAPSLQGEYGTAAAVVLAASLLCN